LVSTSSVSATEARSCNTLSEKSAIITNKPQHHRAVA
jgi:hypothetical protein